jgi:hypothetical protein
MRKEDDKETAVRETDDGVSRLGWLRGFHDRLGQDRSRCHVAERRWSRARLIIFLAGLATLVLLRHHSRLALPAAAAGLAAFAGAVVRHLRWEDRRASAERLLIVTEESLHASSRRDRPARAWERPADPTGPPAPLPLAIQSGPTWLLTEQERDDLDLYGPPVGIFGLLNRTSTQLGARRLRDMLDAPCLSGMHILGRQHAVQWLDSHDEQRLGLMAAIVPLRSCSQMLDALVRLLHTTPALPRSRVSQAVRLWSVGSGLLFVWAVLRIAGGQYVWVRPLMALITVNILILLLLRPMLARRKAAALPWASQRFTLARFLAAAQHAATALPGENQLGLLKSRFRTVIVEAHIPSLCTWLEWAGLHGMVRSLLDIVVFLDLHIAEAVLARVVAGREAVLNGLSALAELEALCSLACFSAEQPVACYPQPTREMSLTIEDGRHPLLATQEAVANDVHLARDKRTWVITGPNAAGKSTFLRMIGVNVLLAQTGTAAAARAMNWSPMRLITDVRIRDDLAKNESYFLSEVRRLRRLVLDSDPDTAILGLIDEPFRGTNSQERAAAGVALLEYLMASRHLFLIATHEDLLARVAASTASAANYHFQEHLHEGGIAFDYRLRPGPATTRTALRILQREGYPASLLERARRLMAGGAPGGASE